MNISLQINNREALDVVEFLDNLNREFVQNMIDKYRIQDIRISDIISISQEVIGYLQRPRFKFNADARIEELALFLNPLCDEDIEELLEGYEEEDTFAIGCSLEGFLDDLNDSIQEFWDMVEGD